MATLATQPVEATGTAITWATASGSGDKAHVGDNVFLGVKNGSGASITVTLVTTATEESLAVADNAVTVAAGAETFIGPLSAGLYRNASDGLCAISYSAATSVSVAALQF